MLYFVLISHSNVIIYKKILKGNGWKVSEGNMEVGGWELVWVGVLNEMDGGDGKKFGGD